MNLSNPAIAQLYQQLQIFPFVEEGAEFSFLDRLADENNWLPAHAAAVLEEYRCFLVLALFAGHPVTPSDDVDQAWHLHLLYSHSYWDELCGQVLNTTRPVQQLLMVVPAGLVAVEVAGEEVVVEMDSCLNFSIEQLYSSQSAGCRSDEHD